MLAITITLNISYKFVSNDNTRHCVKMLVYKEVYQYFLHIQNKVGKEGDKM